MSRQATFVETGEVENVPALRDPLYGCRILSTYGTNNVTYRLNDARVPALITFRRKNLKIVRHMPVIPARSVIV